MKTKDVMTSPAVCCTIDGSLARAAEEMWDYEIHTMPVVDEQDRPIGSVTDRCICMAALRANRRLEAIQVKAAMLVGVPRVHQELPVAQLEPLMDSSQVRLLAVVEDDGRLVGVVSAGDVDRALRELTCRSRPADPGRTTARNARSGALPELRTPASS